MDKYFYYMDKDVTCQYIRLNNPDPELFFLHTHNFYELLIFMGGKGTYKIEGASYELKNGDIVILRPGEAHYIDLDTSIPYERVVIHFRDYMFEKIDPELKLLEPFNNRNPGCLNLYRSQDFESNNYSISASNIIAPAENRRLQVLTNIFPLLLEITKAFDAKRKNSQKTTLIQKILTRINENVVEDIDLDTLCQQFFISKAQLCRIFKKETSTTIYNYIIKKRLMTAQKLIMKGESPTTVYLNCGFNDYSSFFRAYKKEYGYSPNKTNKNMGLSLLEL